MIGQGSLADTPYWDDPKKNDKAYEILSAMETTNIRDTESLYEVCA